MKILPCLSVIALTIGSASCAFAQGWNEEAVVVTASNATNNQLLVYSTADKLIQSIATGGAGGASGNAGGIAYSNNKLAVVNFGSQNVSVFEKTEHGFQLKQLIATASSPVSVAFGHNHLYVLGTTHVESHRIYEFGVDLSADGSAPLVLADGSAAQVGVIATQLILSEKNNAIESVNLNGNGAVVGAAALVSNIPSNVNAPFGLATRGNDAYVTIAHADEISLVRNDAVVTVTGSGTQHAPCWLALDGPFLFSSNSPSMSISRYLVYGQKIIQQAAVAATLNGDPTDIAYQSGMIAVIDSNATVAHLSLFNVDGDGNLTLRGATSMNSANGVAIVRTDD
ncbi:MAG TPA: hypothetical protein VGG85_18420 [Terracidiphilus sp.]|jgi:hypothetical protein